jgi:hypothetical protein
MATSPILGRRRTRTRLGSPTRPTSRAQGAGSRRFRGRCRRSGRPSGPALSSSQTATHDPSPAVPPRSSTATRPCSHQRSGASTRRKDPEGASAHIPRRRLGSGSRPVPAAVRGVLEAVAPQTDRPAQPSAARRRRPPPGTPNMQGPQHATSPRSRPHGTGRLVRRQPNRRSRRRFGPGETGHRDGAGLARIRIGEADAQSAGRQGHREQDTGAPSPSGGQGSGGASRRHDVDPSARTQPVSVSALSAGDDRRLW